MMKTVVDLFLIVASVALACYITYKILIYLIMKTFYLVTESKVFAMFCMAALSALFILGGWLQLSHYHAGKHLENAWHIPVFFGIALLGIISLYFAYKKPNWGDRWED